jgi:glyoxylase-like metal-dependent hydrolase (beta-lactamase superfamily II)
MRNIRFGRFAISKIADMDSIPYPAQRVCPDATPEILRTIAARLGPAVLKPDSLEFMMSFNCFIIRSGRHTALVDACIGNDKERPHRPAWHRRQAPFLDELRGLGLKPEDFDVVLCTHLHADHVGWNTRLVNGQWVPTFPNAQYVMAETEYEYWRKFHAAGPPADSTVHDAFMDSVLPVVAKGQAVMVPMNHEIEPGLYLEGTPGHTPGAVVIHVEDGGQHAVLCGDMMHHPSQVIFPEWSTNFCADPDMSRKARVDFVRRHADTGTRILTGHFPPPTIGQIRRDGSRHRFEFETLERDNV